MPESLCGEVTWTWKWFRWRESRRLRVHKRASPVQSRQALRSYHHLTIHFPCNALHGRYWFRYGCEGVAESALVDDTLNGNPRSSSTSSSSAILPQSHALQSGSAGSIDAADTSGSRKYVRTHPRGLVVPYSPLADNYPLAATRPIASLPCVPKLLLLFVFAVTNGVLIKTKRPVLAQAILCRLPPLFVLALSRGGYE